MRTRTAALAAGLLLLLGGGHAPAAAAQEPTVEHQVVHSFDGVPIHSTLFLPPGASAEAPVPLVLRTHGWSGTRETDLGSGTLRKLVAAGYAVLTWDSRGFGRSGGETHVDAPNVERRDASALLDWAAQRPEIEKERRGDPVVGFTGGSYAGGIQLVTAAFDERVDAVAPEITWYDLRHSLYPNGVPKLGWGEALYGAGLTTALVHGLDPTDESGVQTGAYADEIHQSYVDLQVNDGPSRSTDLFYASRSLVGYGAKHPVDVPALFLQGSTDTLFTLNEALEGYRHVRAGGAPAKLVVFCGGHVDCPDSYVDAGDRAHLDRAILAWFDRYLKGERRTDTGPAVEYRTNAHGFRGLPDLPAPGAGAVTADGSGTLVGTGVPTSGRALTATPSQESDPTAVTVPVATAPEGGLELVGVPEATVSVSRTGGGADAVNLFLKLVDRESGEVVNLQEQAVRVKGLSAGTRRTTLDLAGIAYTLPAGHHLDLQVATSSAAYSASRGGPVRLDVDVSVSVPTPGPSAAR